MTEKDRFGDKLREKEKAEEDRYFAEQDKRKLEEMKKGKEPTAAGARGLCPRCGIRLDERQHAGVSIDVCADCGGIWLDKGELEAIGEREGEGWMSRMLRSVLEGDS
jgi:hypothetical protein